MRKILEASLEVSDRVQTTVIVREHESGEQTTEVILDQPLMLEDDVRGHEMVLARR